MQERVQQLKYRVVYLDDLRTVSATAPPLKHSFPGFDCTVADGRLTVEPTVDYPDEASARAALEPWLQAWEADAELSQNCPLSFIFMYSHVVKIGPGANLGSLAGVAMGVATAGSVSVSVVHGVFPAPPLAISCEGRDCKNNGVTPILEVAPDD